MNGHILTTRPAADPLDTPKGPTTNRQRGHPSLLPVSGTGGQAHQSMVVRVPRSAETQMLSRLCGLGLLDDH
jgi:hypothetical protein